MNLVKISDVLYVPTDFAKFHHYYADELGDKEYTGITSILSVLAKPALIGWAAKMAVEYLDAKMRPTTSLDEVATHWADWCDEAKSAHRKKKEEAGAHGTDAHLLVEEYIGICIRTNEGKPVEAAPEQFGAISRFTTWAFADVDHFIFSERRMADAALFVAGTADFAAVMKDGKKLMGDFKTSSGIYGIDYWLQVAAYRMLAEGEGDAPYDGSVIVRLGKKGPEDFEVKYVYEYETFRDAFLACLTLYRAQAITKGFVIN